MPGLADERELLARRAADLATPIVAPRSGATLDLVSFQVGREVFAIEARFVREVVRLQQLSPVPGAPAAVRGVTTYQGDILAIVDLLGALGIEGAPLRDALWVVVLGAGAADFGVIADELRGSLEVHVDALMPAGAGAGGSRFISATTADAIAVLDGEVLLASESLFGRTSSSARAVMRDDHESTADQKESTK